MPLAFKLSYLLSYPQYRPKKLSPLYVSCTNSLDIVLGSGILSVGKYIDREGGEKHGEAGQQ